MDYETIEPLWRSGTEAALHGMKDIEDPGDKARRIIQKIASRRSNEKA